MRKYIYGTVLIAVFAAVIVFFFRPPLATNRPSQTTLQILFHLPPNYELTESAPFLLTWQSESPNGKLSVAVPDKGFNPLASPYKMIFSPEVGSSAVILNARLYYCHTVSRMCFQGDYKARVPLTPGVKGPIPYLWEITPKNGER